MMIEVVHTRGCNIFKCFLDTVSRERAWAMCGFPWISLDFYSEYNTFD